MPRNIQIVADCETVPLPSSWTINWLNPKKKIMPKLTLVTEFEPAAPGDKNPDYETPVGYRWLFNGEVVKSTDRFYNWSTKTIQSPDRYYIGKSVYRLYRQKATGYIRKFVK
jgi:hypothetical protein